MTLEDVAMLKEKLGELDDYCHEHNLPPLGVFWRLKAFLRALLRAPPAPTGIVPLQELTPEQIQIIQEETKRGLLEKACEAHPGTTPDDWTLEPVGKEEDENED